MKKAKITRAPYKRGKGAVDKYVGILYEIHAQAQKRRATTSITNIATKNNASKSLGSVMKRMGIVKGRFPRYQWTGDVPNRKMARQVLDAMASKWLDAMQSKWAESTPAKADPPPPQQKVETPRSIRKNAAKKRLIFAFESGFKTVKDACEYAEIGRKTFYDYMDTDPDFAAQINAAAQNYKPKPKPKPKRRTMSLLWGLIKFDY